MKPGSRHRGGADTLPRHCNGPRLSPPTPENRGAGRLSRRRMPVTSIDVYQLNRWSRTVKTPVPEGGRIYRRRLRWAIAPIRDLGGGRATVGRATHIGD